MTRETYERVTRIPGSYDKCLAGIRRLVERGVRVGLKTIALTWNVHEVQAMQEYATSLGLPFRFDSSLNPRVDCGANRNHELQLDARDAVKLDLADPERMRQFKEFCDKFARPGRERDTEHVYTCGAGHTSFTVDPYGQLLLCQLSRRNGYDLREGSFTSGWESHFPKLRERKWQSNAVCRSCNLLSLCSNCSGAAEMETGDPEGIIPAFCELTHLRAWAAMGESSGHREDASCCLPKAVAAARSAGDAHDCGGGCGPRAAETGLIQIGRRRSPALSS
jgi:radical SAM protein with 4Fe4S-binding SPASM domain